MSKAAADRMIETTAVLMREQGVEATSFSDVLVRSGAPRGSIYYYFPRGKAQLIEEATRYGVQFVIERITAALEDRDTATAIATFGEFYVQLLCDSDFAAGCPIVPAALEGDRTPPVRDLAGEGFKKWEELIAAGLQRDGLAAGQAASLATLVISSLEGALVLARAQRAIAPFERVLDQLQAVTRDTVERARRSESVPHE
jgi:AcrR family transcriptional regulator